MNEEGYTDPERVKLGKCDPDVIFVVVNAAIAKARAFFGVPVEFESYVFNEPAHGQADDCPLRTQIHHEYLFHDVYVNAPAVDSYALAWKYAAHEVAHLQTRELARLHDRLPADVQGDMREGIEAATTRLDRLFLRHCPYPGDEHFLRRAASDAR